VVQTSEAFSRLRAAGGGVTRAALAGAPVATVCACAEAQTTPATPANKARVNLMMNSGIDNGLILVGRH